VYDRRYEGKELLFEPSGGLLNAALVMRDRPTDSWWAIMTGNAIGGELQGTSLKEIPVSEKSQWSSWRARYPDTRVLSVDGVEHDPRNPYDRYFESTRTFRELKTPDKRLDDKTSVYAFQEGGVFYAVPHAVIEGGAVFEIAGDREVFLFRKRGWSLYASTFAYIADRANGKSRFESRDGAWIDAQTGARFSETSGFSDEPSEAAAKSRAELFRMGGFDTFWYIWSATHDGVTVLQ
jgi:hypothetical protein